MAVCASEAQMAANHRLATERTTYPMVTGGSILGIKYAGGVMLACDTLGSYGSLAKFPGISRMSAVGTANDTIICAAGEYSDYQEILKMINKRSVYEYSLDDGATISPKALHHWLTTVMYGRRSKFDPLWNKVLVAGFRDGASYLGVCDLYGTKYEDNFIATGLGAHLALPLMRKEWKEDMSEAEARKLMTDCLRVLFYRDTQASSFVTIGKIDATGSSVGEPFQLDTYWEYPQFLRGGGHLGDGSW